MRTPLSWLQEFIPTKDSPDSIAQKLTLIGLEVDAIENMPLKFSGVIVARVNATSPHPEADKLTIATVFDGSEEYQVVCGAPNCREGLITAFAKIGTRVYDPHNQKTLKIKKSKLRGIESQGMLCAEDELGLSSLHEGIIEFDPELSPGTPLETLFSETILDIALTPNLAHCQSILGIARELSATTGIPINEPPPFPPLPKQSKQPEISVSIQDEALCPLYSCQVIHNIKVAPSPDWMQRRLEAAGIRPINNIVDITNYVMLTYGQPLHAFDLREIHGEKITIAPLGTELNFITLDDQTRQLPAGTLTIQDGERVLAVAGVMGGENSGITDDTTSIVLESAYFNPSHIRKSSKTLKLPTESSKRFERGVNPNGILFALQAATKLYQELCQGTTSTPPITAGTTKFLEKCVTCRLEKLNSFLGTQLARGEVGTIFSRLGFNYDVKNDIFKVNIPTYRVDITLEVDLFEEVARIYGFDNIPTPQPQYQASTQPHSPIYLFETLVRNRLSKENLQEFLSCDLISPKQLENIGESKLDPNSIIHVLNPSSHEQSILRPSMLPALLEIIKHNENHQQFDLAGFEIGKVHFKQEEFFKEQEMIGIIQTGQRDPLHWSHAQKEKELDFFDLKGVLENLFNSLSISNVKFTASTYSSFHPGQQAAIHCQDVQIGMMGEIHPKVLRAFDITQRVYFAETNLHALLKLYKPNVQMEQLSVYPGSTRDWTITLEQSISYSDLIESINNTPSKLLEKVEMLDLYQNEKLGSARNITLRFHYRDKKKTIAQQTVDKQHKHLCNAVSKKLNLDLEVH